MSGRSYSAEKQPLLAGEGFPGGPARPGDYSRVYNHGPRRATDRAWLIAYLLFVAACVGGGAYALWRGWVAARLRPKYASARFWTHAEAIVLPIASFVQQPGLYQAAINGLH
jgi:hypothetical protein